MKGFYRSGIPGDYAWYPEYPDLGATVVKFRREAAKAGALMALPREVRRAYADAIFKAIRAKHRTLHMKPSPPTTPGWYSPPSITRLLKYKTPLLMKDDPDWRPKCSCPRYTCNCDQWGAREEVLYAQAMKEKHGPRGRPVVD
jgi:hypothetical protein